MTTWTRSLPSTPITVDTSERSFWATVATSTPVMRSDARGRFAEVLDVEALDPATLIGLPALDWHGSGSVNKVLGKVIDARRAADGSIEAKFQISSAEPKVMTKVTEGDITGTSVGYRVSDWQESVINGIRTKTARQWTVTEISLTPTPADPACQIRSIPLEEITGSAAVEVQHIESANRGPINAMIRSVAEVAGLDRGLDRAWADSRIDAGVDDIGRVRAEAFEAMQARGVKSHASIQVIADHTDPVLVRSAMANALASRLDPTIALDGRAERFRGWSALDMGAELCRSRGERVDARDRATTADLLTRSGGHSTSDFPLLLESALNKVLVPRYQTAAPTYKSWSAQRAISDFRAQKTLRLGDFPALKEVTAEGGEPKYGTISESRETWYAKEFATGISISRKALINDDLGALQEFSSLIGQRVASDENSWNYSLLAANPTMADGDPLFHANHGNLAGSATAISVTSLAVAMAAVRKQKSIDGILLNLNPEILVVGPDVEVIARQYMTQISPNTSSAVNPWAGQFKIVVDSNIADKAWYLFCSPSAAPTFVHGYVASTGPVVRSEIDFETRGIKVVVGLDYGYAAIDYRGAYKNAGA